MKTWESSDTLVVGYLIGLGLLCWAIHDMWGWSGVRWFAGGLLVIWPHVKFLRNGSL